MLILNYLAKTFYWLLSLLRWKSLEQYFSVLLDFEQKLKKDWGLNSFLSILLIFNIFLAMLLFSSSWSLCYKFSIYFYRCCCWRHTSCFITLGSNILFCCAFFIRFCALYFLFHFAKSQNWTSRKISSYRKFLL